MTIRWTLPKLRTEMVNSDVEHGKIRPWQPNANANVSSTSTASPALSRATTSAAFSATRWRGSFPSFVAQKNGLQGLRASAHELVRPHDPSRPRPVLRRHADLPRIRSAAPALPLHWQSETRTARFSGRQPALHETVCLVRRSPLPVEHREGCGQGTETALGRGQGTRQGLHARRKR